MIALTVMYRFPSCRLQQHDRKIAQQFPFPFEKLIARLGSKRSDPLQCFRSKIYIAADAPRRLHN